MRQMGARLVRDKVSVQRKQTEDLMNNAVMVS